MSQELIDDLPFLFLQDRGYGTIASIKKWDFVSFQKTMAYTQYKCDFELEMQKEAEKNAERSASKNRI